MWPEGITEPQKLAALAELAELKKTLGLEASSANVRKSIFDSNIAQVNRKIEELELRNSELKSQ